MSRKKSKKKSRKTNPQLLRTIHHYAAGIDLGAREHFVAAPPLEDGEPNVERFGTTTPELFRLAQWLKEQHVDTVAMESTGVYWIPVFELLESQGFEVLLVNARHIRNVPGRKTDMLDCQWIQMLHTCGLLKGSFRPSDDICQLRSLLRERNTMVAQRSDWVRRMQKGLDQMNICVHHAVSDITGTTGMAIIRAIVGGERDPKALARLRDRRCRKTEEQIAENLTGNWRAEHLFNLEQALKMYDQLCIVIEDYDNEILSTIISLQPDDARDKEVPPPSSKPKAKNIAKRGQEPLREALYRFAGVDLTSINGIGVDTAAVLISELGLDYSKFPKESEFVSYLRLAPNLFISAGKKVPNKSKLTTCTRVSTALRMAALTLRNSKTALGGYYRRVARNKGASVAVFATARKLAELVYRMVRYGQAYVDTGLEAYEARFNQRRINSYTNYLKSQGFKVVPIETEEAATT
jgi:transposase